MTLTRVSLIRIRRLGAGNLLSHMGTSAPSLLTRPCMSLVPYLSTAHLSRT